MMKMPTHQILLKRFMCFAILLVCNVGAVVLGSDFQVSPPLVEVSRHFSTTQLLVTEADSLDRISERSGDLTSKAHFHSADPKVATVSPNGLVTGLEDGETAIHVTLDGITKQVPIHVKGLEQISSLEFCDDVLPILFKHGCNSGSCHASQYGKGGFTLSVMGFDPVADFNAVTRSSRGRRVTPSNPETSLLLRKPTMSMPHGGGKRFEVDSNDYRILSAWIGNGANPPAKTPRKLIGLNVVPSTRIGNIGFHQQLRVLARYADGSERDVTSWARFDSVDESVVSVTSTGLGTATGPGQAPIMVRFGGEASLCNIIVPFSYKTESADLADTNPLGDWTARNIVDVKAEEKFRELRIIPSGVCDDATFLRRAFLDSIGALPTIEEAQTFLDSTDPNKRERLIDQLLGLTGDSRLDIYHDRYAAFWSLKWADLIRNNSAVLGESGMWALHNWLKDSFRTNKPFDQFVQELITAKGSIFSNGPANYFRIANNPADLAESTAQLFLGTRLQCAKCHHHPYEKYSQADYYGFAAFFARVGTKASAEFGNFGGEMIVMVSSGGEVSHPKTGAIMKPTPIGGEPVEEPMDRRVPLANWLTNKENEAFARNIVNRYVGYLLGRGLVEPIDDMRSTNPPSNIGLMDALTQEFRESQFNVKHLMRTIMTSRLYQLDSQPHSRNRDDTRFYSHYKVKRIAAEPLLDCIDYATGSQTKHPSLPLGTRATDLPDANTTNPFLMTFGKPKRASVCECERTPDENLTQALHMLNGDILASKIADTKGRIANLLAAKKTSREIVEQLYLATLCRRPTAQEFDTAEQLIGTSPSQEEAYQDLLWALINSKQFLFIR